MYTNNSKVNIFRNLWCTEQRTDISHDVEKATVPAEQPTASVSAVIWNRSKTLLLLFHCKERKQDLEDPNRKKKRVWQSISADLAEKGEIVSWEVCEKKFRNLKQTYKNIKDNSSKTGRGNKTWEFYDLMDDLLRRDATIQLPNIIEVIYF